MAMTTLEKILTTLQPMRPVLPHEGKRWERNISFLLSEVCQEIDVVIREYGALLNEHNKVMDAMRSELTVKKEEVQPGA